MRRSLACTHWHRCPTDTHFAKFVHEFGRKVSAVIASGIMSLIAFQGARIAMWEKYSEIWSDASRLELAISCLLLLRIGTDCILKGNYGEARFKAAVTSYLEQCVQIMFRKTQPAMSWGKVAELYDADEHTLVSFFRKRISCKCLDEKYDEVKSIVKMGLCANPKCSLHDRKTVRSKRLYCTKCRLENYCSRECQVSHWKRHKEHCEVAASVMAELKMRRKQYSNGA